MASRSKPSPAEFQAHFGRIHQDSADELDPEQRRVSAAAKARVAADMVRVGMLAILWKPLYVVPTLTFGSEVSPLTHSGVVRLLDSFQAASIKVAVGLPKSSHHTALLIGNATENYFNSFFCIFRTIFC